MSPLAVLFSLKGRLRRRDFWLYGLGFVFLLSVCDNVLAAITDYQNVYEETELPPLAMIIGELVMLLLALAASLGLLVKRWHDRGKSGWMYLVLFIPILGLLWILAECGCADGTQGANNYGPSPKGVPPDVF